MELKELRKALAAEAQAAGICSEWYNYILSAQSKERLLALYFKGFDFVEENDFPSEPLRREFDDIRRHYGIYENEPFSVTNTKRLVAYTGATGKAAFNSYAVGQIWARKGSDVHVEASEHSYVNVYVVEGATAHIKATGKSRVTVFLHGGKVTQEATEDAVITIKEK